jgi:hypothetical protein
MKYRVTRKFLDGILQGLTFTEDTDQEFILGKVYQECLTGNHYEIISIYIYAE